MVNFPNILIAITALFVLYLLLRSVSGIKLCALCAAVSTAWIGLLVLRFLGFAVDSLAVAILMGGSAVGSMYLLGAKVPERWNMLKLPFLLTLFALIYFLLGETPEIVRISLILVALWTVFLSVFSLSVFKPDRLGKIAKKLTECCKNW